MPVGCGIKHAKKTFKRLKGLKRVTPGERQAGPPRRSHGCGLGVAFACAVGRSEKLFQSFKGFKPFKRLRPGKGRLGRPEEAIDVALGACWLRDEACQAEF